MNTLSTPDLFHSLDSQDEQFKLAQIETYNWGTFQGRFEFRIPQVGFLFAGPSGTGKSTALDAHAALMTPPRWLKFNVAAARDGDRQSHDRNLMSYVRGAWAQQTAASGEAVSQFLRPGTTWSAIAETYRNQNCRIVVLAQIFWIRGNTTANNEVRKLYMVIEREFSLRELEVFPQFDFNVRKLKAALPDAFIQEEFSAYQERFRRLLDIDSELALRLLHKTQSAKNLGDLNNFLRDFMLDVPETFDIADRLVTEFSELNAAHQAVVAARQQISVLRPAYADHERREDVGKQLHDLQELKVGIDPYEEKLKKRLLEARIQELEVARRGLEDELRLREDQVAQQQNELLALQAERLGLGGDQIEQLQAQIADAERAKPGCLEKKSLAETAASALGHVLPDNPRGFAELTNVARQNLDAGPERTSKLENLKYELRTQEQSKSDEFNRLRREIVAMERQPSNIPAHMLDLRHAIAESIGVPENKLPYAGELLEVKDDAQSWQGAIERVLHGFALSLLVDEKYYSAVSRYLNDHHIGQRLVYLRMTPHPPVSRPLATKSLIGKLNVAKGPCAEWLRDELRARYDYTCADDIEEFKTATRAITQQGQVKHGLSKHEKDDRTAIDDQSNWILGFDNTPKLNLFKNKATDVAVELATVSEALRKANDEATQHQRNQLHCQTLANLIWADIDIGSLLLKIKQMQERIDSLMEGRPALAVLEARIQEKTDLVNSCLAAKNETDKALLKVQSDIELQRSRQKELREELLFVSLTPFQQEGLATRYASFGKSISPDNVAQASRHVDNSISEDRGALENTAQILKNEIENRFAEFNRNWPAESGGLDPKLDSAPDYFAKLDRLEKDNLPRYEQRFLELLREQSDQNLTLLASQLKHERQAILDRLELVNESLLTAQFNPGTHLVIEPTELTLEKVKGFQADLKAALSHSFTGSAEQAEERFQVLRSIVHKLASQEPESRNWRALVLDVRQHVEFSAREMDSNNQEVEVYRSGAGKSGGQKQKLAATVLAAALRYQLGGPDRTYPGYSTVVIDEAFDQADAEFTSIAMNIFKTFGFQMVVATPLKAVMAMEPFIGGACVVDIKDRKYSSALNIDYDDATKRLNLPAHVRKIIDEAPRSE